MTTQPLLRPTSLHATAWTRLWPMPLLPVLAALVLGSLAQAVFAGETCQTLDDCPCMVDMVESTLARGWVGIHMENTHGKGWVVTEVVPGGPAARAGLRRGDELKAMNGVPMSKDHEAKLAKIYENMVPDSELVYTVERDGSSKDVTITLGRLPKKILSIILGQQLIERYAMTAGKELDLSSPPAAPRPPEKPPAPKPNDGP